MVSTELGGEDDVPADIPSHIVATPLNIARHDDVLRTLCAAIHVDSKLASSGKSITGATNPPAIAEPAPSLAGPSRKRTRSAVQPGSPMTSVNPPTALPATAHPTRRSQREHHATQSIPPPIRPPHLATDSNPPKKRRATKRPT